MTFSIGACFVDNDGRFLVFGSCQRKCCVCGDIEKLLLGVQFVDMKSGRFRLQRDRRCAVGAFHVDQ